MRSVSVLAPLPCVPSLASYRIRSCFMLALLAHLRQLRSTFARGVVPGSVVAYTRLRQCGRALGCSVAHQRRFASRILGANVLGAQGQAVSASRCRGSRRAWRGSSVLASRCRTREALIVVPTHPSEGRAVVRALLAVRQSAWHRPHRVCRTINPPSNLKPGFWRVVQRKPRPRAVHSNCTPKRSQRTCTCSRRGMCGSSRRRGTGRANASTSVAALLCLLARQSSVPRRAARCALSSLLS